MPPPIKVKVDNTNFNKFKREIIKENSADIGVFSDETYPNGIAVSFVAALHEFGIGVPRRSWLMDFFEEEQASIIQRMEKIALVSFRTGRDPSKAFMRLAEDIVGEIQARILDSIPPANAESTVRIKGHGMTLVDTFRFLKAIDFKARTQAVGRV